MKSIRCAWSDALIVVLMSVALFCFWGYGFPQYVMAREQTCLFLWSADYLWLRLASVGGLASYVADFVAQFFYVIKWGVIAFIVLFWLLYIAVRMLMKRYMYNDNHWLLMIIPLAPSVIMNILMLRLDVQLDLYVALIMSAALMAVLPRGGRSAFVILLIIIPIAYWLIGPVAFLLVLPWLTSVARALMSIGVIGCCIIGSYIIAYYPLRTTITGINYVWSSEAIFVSNLELETDFCVRLNMPKRLSAMLQADKPKSVAVREVEQYISRSTISPQAHAALNSCVACFIMSDIYLRMGMVSMSQRAAFEGLVAMPNGRQNGRAIKRLAETALIMGEYDLAHKYIATLKQTHFYRDWAQMVEELIADNAKFERNKTYVGLRKIYLESNDKFFY